jgi:hypothetical protein
VTSGVGGMLFDAIDPRAPFVLLGVMNLVVMASALYVRYNENNLKGMAAAISR